MPNYTDEQKQEADRETSPWGEGSQRIVIPSDPADAARELRRSFHSS
ncbi:MAG: hypothetical protein WC891_04050 [Actinomycetota bacterium]